MRKTPGLSGIVTRSAVHQTSCVKKYLLLQADMACSGDRTERLNYLLQADTDILLKSTGEADGQRNLHNVVVKLQAVIAAAFPGRILTWAEPEETEGIPPGCDPLYRLDGLAVWIKPVVADRESYFYLVG